jgi:hypothetical protein
MDQTRRESNICWKGAGCTMRSSATLEPTFGQVEELCIFCMCHYTPSKIIVIETLKVGPERYLEIYAQLVSISISKSSVLIEIHTKSGTKP